MSLNGNQPVAEELVWRELFRNPDSRHARWALWELYSREANVWSHLEHDGGAQTIRFSPDGSLIATAGRLDGVIHLLDAQSGRLVRTLSWQPLSGTRRVLFSPDGRLLVGGSADGSVRVWDVAAGTLHLDLPQVLPGLLDVALDHRAAEVLVLSRTRLEAWSLGTGQRVRDLSRLVTRAVAIAGSPVASLVAVGGEDASVTVIDIATGARRWRGSGHEGQAISVAFDPTGRMLASGGADGSIQLWEAASGARLRSIDSENGRARTMAFDRSGSTLAVAGLWRTRVWNLGAPDAPPRDVGASEGMTDAQLHPDGRLLATCNGGSGLVRMWDLGADARTDRWDIRAGAITGLAIGADASALVSASGDGVVSLWHEGRVDPVLTVRARTRVNGFDLSRNGRWMLVVGYPGAASVWDARHGRLLAELPGVRYSRAATFADGDQRIVVGESDGTLKIWEWSEVGGARNLRVIPPSGTEVLALASHGTRVFAAHRSQTVIARDVHAGDEIRRWRPSSSPFSLALTPEGRLLAAGTWLGAVDVWEAESGRPVASLKGQTALATSVDFSIDGSLLAVASRDGTTRLWDVAASQSLATIAARRVGAERVRFLPGDRRLAIGYIDGLVEIRDLDYFFRHAAGNADYQLRLLRQGGELFPRADDVLAWSRRVLAPR
jgi:WD40 repeat protein